MFHRDADFLADIGGDDLIVAGQDLDVHAQTVQPLQGLRSSLFWRVEEGQKTEQDQVRLILDRVDGFIRGIRHLLIGQGDHPKALTVQVVRYLPAFGIVFGLNRDHLLLQFHPGAQAQHFLHRALTDQRVHPGFIFHHHRHPSPYKVEGNLVNLTVLFFRLQVFFQFLMVEDRFIEQILQPSMVIAVQVAVLQDLLAGIAMHVQVLCH